MRSGILLSQLLALCALLTLAGAASDSLLWGTYRPGVYIGMRARLPDSPLFGVLWHGLKDYKDQMSPRHETGEGGDEIKGYDWNYHDGRTWGEQVIKDVGANVEVKTQWLKSGAGWAMRVSGEPIEKSRPALLALYAYTSASKALEPSFDEDDAVERGGLAGSSKPTAILSGRHSNSSIGEFELSVADTPGVANVAADPEEEAGTEWSFYGKRTERGWAANELITRVNQETVRDFIAENGRDTAPPPPAALLKLSNDLGHSPNFIAVARNFKGAFSIDFTFAAAVSKALTGEELSAGLRASKEAFDERFERTLSLSSKGYSAELIAYARRLTSSLLGGIGYWSGAGIVDRTFRHEYDIATGGGAIDFDEPQDTDPNPQLTEEMELFSATPSRTAFPRGFYWDEGFHLAHIGEWDNDLSLEILESWINLIDEDGWVAREQILGEEARKRVPKEFQTQYPIYANPPTLTMAVTMYIDRLMRHQGAPDDAAFDASVGGQQVLSGAHTPAEGSAEAEASRHLRDADLARAFLQRIYPRLRTHYAWFRRTQRGEINEWDRTARSPREAYRWRGRTKDHVLTSGLDDYPRAKVPHSGELHLDLMSWMGFFSDTMRKIAEATGEKEDAEEYAKNYQGVLDNLEDLHWNEDEHMYCDASVDAKDESFHVCHKGYVSLFPFLLGLLPADSPRLGPILDLLSDPAHLWSDYGIRSLSKQDEHFGKGENYWRGPIWMPMNYMALASLHKKYARQEGPQQKRAAELYSKLRENLIQNTFKEYKRTGYTWEQYHPTTGQGQRNHPFTGWTSTVALIMAERY